MNFVVIGAGGLGCPALLGLAAGGAERITIVDHDRVEASNLQRQVLFTLADIGRPKAKVAAWALAELVRRPMQLAPIERRIDPAQASAFVAELEADAIVLECTDDPSLEFALHDACVGAERPIVVGGVVGMQGQAMAVDPRADRACLRCVFEAPPPRELAPACSSVGVLGAGAGAIGHMMAMLALRLAAGEDAAGTLIHFDFRNTSVRTLSPAPRKDCPNCSSRA